jgi:hypothetical protein
MKKYNRDSGYAVIFHAQPRLTKVIDNKWHASSITQRSFAHYDVGVAEGQPSMPGSMS